MGCEWNELASNKCVALLVASRTQWRATEESCQVERHKSIQDNYFVCRISVDGIVEWEVGCCVVERDVQS